MANLNINLKNKGGDVLYPQTLASNVFNASNQNLGTVEPGAQVNVIESITVNGSPATVTNKTAAITVITMEQVRTEIASYNHASFEKVDALPTADIEPTKIYLVPNESGEENDVYDQYIYVDGEWEKIGTTKAELELDKYALATDLTTGLAGKADKTHVHVINDITGLQNALDAKLTTPSGGDTGYVLTKTSSGYAWAATSETEIIAGIDAIEKELAKKANASDVNTALSGKADKATTIAGYGITDAYTKTEVNTALSGKADASTVTTLGNTVATKADASALEALEAEVDKKVNESDLVYNVYYEVV